MIEYILPRRRRRPIGRAALRDRSAVARRYLATHRLARSRRGRLIGIALRSFATALLLSVGVLLAEQVVLSAGAAVDAVSAGVQHLLPAPVVEREGPASAEPAAPKAAPVLDPFDRVTKDSRLVVSGRLPSFALAGSAQPRVEISVNGALAASPALDVTGSFSATVALAAGTNTVVVAAVRGADRVEAPPRTVILDTVAPPLTVTKPAEGDTLEGPTVTVQGRTEAAASVTVNGHATSVRVDGSFTDSIETTQAGPLTIEIVTRDPAGNETKRTLRVTVKQSGQTAGLSVSVTLDKTTVRPGGTVTADILVSDVGGPARDVSVTVNAGLATVASGRTDAGGHFKVAFTAPATEGFVQVIALVSGSGGTLGRGAATLEVSVR